MASQEHFIARLVLPALLGLAALSACSPSGGATPPPAALSLKGREVLREDPAARSLSPSRRSDASGHLNLSDVPWTSEENLKKLYSPICRYLGEQLKASVVFNIAPDYGSLQKDLEQDNIQIAIFSPGAYANALREIPDIIRYVATIQWSDSYFYKGYIFTRRDSGISSLADMHGKTIAFTDVHSSSGYEFPVTLFLEKGIDPDRYFSAIFFLGSHDNVLAGVDARNVQIGATNDTSYSIYQRTHHDPFRVILETPEIPYAAVAVRSSLPGPLFKKLQSVFAGLNRTTRLLDGTLVLQDSPVPISGFAVKNNAIYSVVARMSELNSGYLGSRKK